MATYCSECGTMIQEGETVCRRCGTPVGGQSAPQNPVANYVQAQVQPVENTSMPLFSELKPYYREEFTKIYDSNGKYRGKFNWATCFAWGPWYLIHINVVVGILLSVLWIVSLFIIPLLPEILVGIFMGLEGTMMYYKSYMKKRGLLN